MKISQPFNFSHTACQTLAAGLTLWEFNNRDHGAQVIESCKPDNDLCNHQTPQVDPQNNSAHRPSTVSSHSLHRPIPAPYPPLPCRVPFRSGHEPDPGRPGALDGIDRQLGCRRPRLPLKTVLNSTLITTNLLISCLAHQTLIYPLSVALHSHFPRSNAPLQ